MIKFYDDAYERWEAIPLDLGTGLEPYARYQLEVKDAMRFAVQEFVKANNILEYSDYGKIL